ncbi:Hint domain-containing protein [Varunaivibrio sulfuroxidans]|uniref:Intein n=1 Tax=Varunaivibrio sulfuroxidans TaxID=1773489 RepID=A0A4R3J4W7_9PROT|nr:Hint domain-containing protein [Varunaivibrio sulfuroxidans]TCS60919.1 intein [Varunaivibrio sulfuroxidans]WES31673.1 Hint domain-containing protein [Varunaivibrio sulfuroxidans]
MNITAEQKELFAYMDALIPENGCLTYDFRDPRQHAFATMMTALADDSDRYPGRLQTLERIRQAQNRNGLSTAEPSTSEKGWQNMFVIPGLGLSKSNAKVASNGFGTIVGGYSSMNLTLIVQDNTTHDIVAHGFSNDFAQAFLPVETAPPTSGGADLDVTAYLHYAYTGKTGAGDSEGFEGSSGVVKRAASDGPTGDPTLKAPIRTTTAPLNPKAINIGLGRAWTDQGGSSQFDYAWNEPVQDHPIGKIPFHGSVTFGSKIKAPLKAKSGLYLDIYVADKTGGGGAELSPTDMDTVYSAFSIDAANPNKLKWKLPAGVSTSDPGNPIKFGHVTWSSDMLAYFYCGMTVVMDNGDLSFAAVQSKDTPDEDPLDGTLEIMPIEFVWHCVAGAAAVTMADGTTKPIEKIIAGDRVATDDGVATVRWTNKGIHKGIALTVRSDADHEITTSGNHVFMTADGPKQAEDLCVGDLLRVEGGALVAIAHIEPKPFYDGLMYNLATRDFQDANAPGDAIATFIANGFIIGDVNAQRTRAHRLGRDIAYVKSRVPAYLHPDVDAFFEDRKA